MVRRSFVVHWELERRTLRLRKELSRDDFVYELWALWFEPHGPRPGLRVAIHEDSNYYYLTFLHAEHRTMFFEDLQLLSEALPECAMRVLRVLRCVDFDL